MDWKYVAIFIAEFTIVGKAEIFGNAGVGVIG